MSAETALGRLSFDALTRWSEPTGTSPVTYRVDLRPVSPAPGVRDVRIGFIRNGKARHNVGRYGLEVSHESDWAGPDRFDELRSALSLFARNGVNALVIDGGDGTIRDVLTIAARCFDRMPRTAIVPSGKTNALAIDLGIPRNWTEKDAVRALRSGAIVERSPLEIRRPDARGPDLQGFIFGAGGFVPATALAQKTHRLGAFNGVAVGLSVASCVVQTLFGRPGNVWRRGTPMRIGLPGRLPVEGSKYLLLASTLERLPAGIRPFGTPRAGLKLLTIDAEPRAIVRTLPALLGGGGLPPRGSYRRDDADSVDLVIKGDFILDGECFPGGALTLSRGAPIGFAVP